MTAPTYTEFTWQAETAGNGFEDLGFTFYGRAPLLWKNMICDARKAA